MSLTLPNSSQTPHPAPPHDTAAPTFTLDAIERWSADHARVWLAAGGSPHVRDESGFPLVIAALNSLDPIGVLRELHAGGADLDASEPDFQWGALHFALANAAAPGVLRFLLEHGVDLERRVALGWTALLVAVSGGSVDAVRLLLQAGADPNVADEQGAAALAFAVHRADADQVVPLLLSYGANADARDVRGENALAMAALTQVGGGVVRALLAAGADPNARAQDGSTPLLLAASSNADACNIEALLEYGADPLARYPDGTSVLEAALMMADDARSINLLLRAGCDPKRRGRRGETMLELAKGNPAYRSNPAFRSYCESFLDA